MPDYNTPASFRLDNLDVPTAVNTDLIPLTSNNNSIGSETANWTHVYTSRVTNIASAGVNIITLDIASGSAASGDLTLGTGFTDTGAGGNIILTPRAPTGVGTRGKIKIQDGSQGSVNRVVKSTNADGSIAFDAAGVSGSFTTVDLKVITVVNGLITAIV